MIDALPSVRQAYAGLLEQAKPLGLDHVLKLMAELCRRDLFFFAVYILGRKDMDNDWLYARCREVQAAPDGRLDLWAREHYKSTIITVALTIQEILRNPEITVGIFSHTRPVAKAFLRQIKREFENNILLKELFPLAPFMSTAAFQGQGRPQPAWPDWNTWRVRRCPFWRTGPCSRARRFRAGP